MKVRIGSTKYDLSTTQCVIQINDKECRGCIDSDMAEIIICKDVPLQIRKQTFWHEALHGMMNELGLEELEHNEGFIDSVGKILYAFHEDNKLDKIYAKLAD